MKNVLVGIMAAFMVFAAAATASASFAEGNLVLAIYNPDDTEIAIDLGSIDDYSATNVALSGALSSDLMSYFTATESISDLSVGIFSYTNAAYDYNSVVGTTDPTQENFPVFGNLMGFETNAQELYRQYAKQGTTLFVGDATTYYSVQMDLNGTTTGAYTGLNKDADYTTGEGVFAAEDSYIDFYLFNYFFDATVDGYVAQNTGGYADGDYLAVVRVYSDGSSVLNPTVPVPGAIVLLGSGLLGLAGLRRS